MQLLPIIQTDKSRPSPVELQGNILYGKTPIQWAEIALKHFAIHTDKNRGL